jgi:hypothetical protein
MADAISANYQAGIGAGTQLLGVYVTGTPDIQWTQAQLAAIPAGVVVVTIDQGSDGSPVADAMVRDVETGAWTPGGAVTEQPWTAARPTIYCSADTLPALEQAGWQGDVWVADWTGSPPAQPYVVPAGMTCVAVQYSDQGGGGAYDLSVVFDPTWPGGNMDAVAWPAVEPFKGVCEKCGVIWATNTTAGNVCAAGGQHSTPAGWNNLAPLIAGTLP